LYGQKFGDEVLDFVSRQLKGFCDEKQFFINLRSDVFIFPARGD
jgi:GGDEF domain-containing protein